MVEVKAQEEKKEEVVEVQEEVVEVKEEEVEVGGGARGGGR